jgi:hypothetical protein
MKLLSRDTHVATVTRCILIKSEAVSVEKMLKRDRVEVSDEVRALSFWQRLP